VDGVPGPGGKCGHWIPNSINDCLDGQECADCSEDCGLDCGACCIDSVIPDERVCLVMTEQECDLYIPPGHDTGDNNDWFDGRQCGCGWPDNWENDCPLCHGKDTNTGGCCLPDSHKLAPCTEKYNQAQCMLEGGIYLGDDVECAWPITCPLAACCFDDNCKVMSEATCISEKGIWLGGKDEPIMNCDDNPCDDLVAACCVPPYGTCLELTESVCLGYNGVWLGGWDEPILDCVGGPCGGMGDDDDDDDDDNGTPPTTPPAGGGTGQQDECEVCPRELVCVTWHACRYDHWNQIIETDCARCIDMPEGGAAMLDGLKVNACCGLHQENINYDDPCSGGGRYTATKLADCTHTSFPHHSQLRKCSEYRNLYCGIGQSCEKQGSDYGCGGSPYSFTQTQQGCCLNESGLNQSNYGFQESMDCTRCQTAYHCTHCDGCNDPRHDDDDDQWGSIPGDCSTNCWFFACQKNLGLDCTSNEPGIGNPLRRFHCPSRGCNRPECIPIGPPPPINAPYYEHWLCDCIDTGLKPSDYCCPGGIKATRDPDNPSDWICPDWWITPYKPSTFNVTKCYCDNIRCDVNSSPMPRGQDDMTKNMTLVRLPEGECVWLMCNPPSCPYPECT